MAGTELDVTDDGGRVVAGADVVGVDVAPGAEVAGCPAAGNVVGVKTAPGEVTGADTAVVAGVLATVVEVGAGSSPEELQAVSTTASIHPTRASRRLRLAATIW